MFMSLQTFVKVLNKKILLKKVQTVWSIHLMTCSNHALVILSSSYYALSQTFFTTPCGTIFSLCHERATFYQTKTKAL